jgi:diadenosine tetraphosphatase ApaH/serine/threonine PP2A family protein phosphatase
MEWTRTADQQATRDWLAALPERHTRMFGLVHGSPREPLWEYIVSIPIARANLALLTTDVGLYGHTHLPMVYAERDGAVEQIEPGDGSMFSLAGRRALVNPGSVGQPRDGIPTACHLVIDTEAERCTWAPDGLRHRRGPGGDARRRPAGPARRAVVVRPVMPPMRR